MVRVGRRVRIVGVAICVGDSAGAGVGVVGGLQEMVLGGVGTLGADSVSQARLGSQVSRMVVQSRDLLVAVWLQIG